jgi:hypothetical protein
VNYPLRRSLILVVRPLMDSKSLHNICTHALQSVTWLLHGTYEYVVVGDGVSLDQVKVQQLVSNTFSSDEVLMSVNRTIGFTVPCHAVASSVAAHLQQNSSIVVTDDGFKHFVQIFSNGVARTGVAA